MKKWISGFKGIEILSGEPRAVESLYKMLIHFNGEISEIYQKILEMQHNQRLLLHMEHPELIMVSEILFSGSEDITEIACNVEIVGKNLKINLAMPIVKSILESRNEKDYLAFKKVVEKIKY